MRLSLVRILAMTGLAASLLATGALATAQEGHNPFPANAGIPALEIGGVPYALSPDGATLAGQDDDRKLCTWSVPDLTPSCVDGFREAPIVDPRSLAWSPDSATIAFSLDAPRMLRDSDLFTLDVATATVTNLTPEDSGDAAPALLDTEGTQQVDLWPSWSPDGGTLAFARSEWGGGSRMTDLMTIPATGGEPVLWGHASAIETMLVSGPLVWDDTAGAPALVYATWAADINGPEHGIFTMAEGGEPIPLVTAGDAPVMAPFISSSRDGGTLLTVTNLRTLGSLDQEGYASTYLVIDQTAGEARVQEAVAIYDLPTEPVEVFSGMQLVSPPGLSPASVATPMVAAVMRDNAASQALALRICTLDGACLADIPLQEANTAGPGAQVPIVQWVDGGTIFVQFAYSEWLVPVPAEATA